MSIRINMAVSLDGKIAPASRKPFRLGSRADLDRMAGHRTWADVIVIGAGTLRAEDPPFALSAEAAAERAAAGRSSQPAVTVVSASLALPAGRVFAGPNRTIVATTTTAPELPAGTAEQADVWRLGTERVDLEALAARLRETGYERILVEGGGGLAAGFFARDLVDEIYLTLTPWLIGGDGSPSICAGQEGLPAPGRFLLTAIEPGAEEVFLTYRRR